MSESQYQWARKSLSELVDFYHSGIRPAPEVNPLNNCAVEVKVDFPSERWPVADHRMSSAAAVVSRSSVWTAQW